MKKETKKFDALDIRLIQLNQYVRPVIEEVINKDWVMNGRDNSFYEYIIGRYNGSPTNAAIINSYVDLMYGRGLTSTNNNLVDWVKFKVMLKDEELKRVIADFVLFGEAGFQFIKKNNANRLPSIHHIPKEKTLPKKKKKDKPIDTYYYAEDWKKVENRQAEPEPFKVFGDKKNKAEKEVYIIRPYKAGKIYFSDPDYLAGMPYAELEEEIANYYLSHIKNGLSFGYIINIPDGNSYTSEEKDEVEKKIRLHLVGSPQAGKFLINFNGRDAKIEITPLAVSDAHSQWEYLTGEARQQLLTAHRVTSPMLFGIKDSTGLGNNADELDTAEAQLMKRVIQPKQQYIISALEDIATFYGLSLDLMFKPLTEPTVIPALEPHKSISFSAQQELNKMIDSTADALIDMGEDIDDVEWELVESRIAESHTLSEEKLLAVLKFARVPQSSPAKTSEQDTSLFKIRYVYVGNPNPEREFCRKLIRANKVYRIEDLEKASSQVVNKGFGPNGTDKYDIFLYKGGVNCKHFWERRIFLRRNNKRIGVNQARRLILELEPNDRADARWVQNPKQVAVIASPSNNFWKLK